MDIKQLAETVSATIKAWVTERLKAIEAALPELVRKQVEALPRPKDGADADPQAMAAEIARQVALLPKPADGKSISEDAVALLVKAEVAKLPPAQKGADADPRLVETLVRATVAEAMAAIRQPADGKSVEPAEVRAMVAAAAATEVAKLPAPDLTDLVQAEVRRAVDALPRPKDGDPGKDADPTVLKAAVALEVREVVAALPPAPAGRDADMEALKLVAAAAAREAVAAIPAPQNGKDADQAAIVTQVFDLVMRALPKPQDGKSVTVDEVKPLLEAEVQHWELEFERRATDVLERLAARYKGKDGADGFTVEDLGIELGADDRTIVVTLSAAGGRVVRREITLAGMPIYRGVFKSGQKSSENDMWTWGGSMWRAKRSTDTPPPGDDWQLVVKGVK